MDKWTERDWRLAYPDKELHSQKVLDHLKREKLEMAFDRCLKESLGMHCNDDYRIEPIQQAIDELEAMAEENKKDAVKHDQGKLRMDLITPEMITALAEVLTFGSNKYGDRNWESGIKLDRLYAACMRHLTTWRAGTDMDDESGLHHVKHALTNLAMLVTFIERGQGDE